MNVSMTPFAQVMEYVLMAFALSTWRESLHDIEVGFTANQDKLLHIGMRGVLVRSTLADALSLRDQGIAMNGFYIAKDYPERLRRIRFKDPESGKTLIFLANTIKWIEPHLRINRFLCTSENAVKTQIWCAVATYVLIAIVNKLLHLPHSLHENLPILSLTVFDTTPINQLLTKIPTDADREIEHQKPSLG